MRRTKERDVGAEPQDGVWWTSPERWKDYPDLAPGVEVLVEPEKLTELTLCRTLGKLRSITYYFKL
jgi:hypothetical protein